MQGVIFQLFVIQREQEQEQELAPGNTNWFATLVQENTSTITCSGIQNDREIQNAIHHNKLPRNIRSEI